MNESIESLRTLVPRSADALELNAGTLSPTPTPVFDAVTELRREQATNPSDFFFHRIGPLVTAARTALAQFLSVSPADLFLLPNVTGAINLALQSIRLSPGDVILTTDHEYGAMTILLEHLARRDQASIRTIKLELRMSSNQIVEAFRENLDDRVKLVFFSHVTSPTGWRLPAERIVDAVRRDDRWIVIDGAHAIATGEVDVGAMRVDAYAANCHKWMMAPCGAGFLAASGRLKRVLTPLVRSWGDAYDAAAMDEPMIDREWNLDFGATRLQYRIEYQGVYDRTPQLVLPETIAFIHRVGLRRWIDRAHELAVYARTKLESCGLNCASPRDRERFTPMTVFDLDEGRAKSLRSNLWQKHRVFCPVTRAAGRSYLRVSTAWFNTEADIDQLAAALRVELN